MILPMMTDCEEAAKIAGTGSISLPGAKAALWSTNPDPRTKVTFLQNADTGRIVWVREDVAMVCHTRRRMPDRAVLESIIFQIRYFSS